MHTPLRNGRLPLLAASTLALALVGAAVHPAAAATPALTVGGASLSGATVASGATVTASPPAGTVKVTWVLDGTYLGTDSSAPFTWPLAAAPGTHKLRARMYDASGNQAKPQASFTVRAASVTPPATPTPPPPPPPATGQVTAVSTSASLVTALAAAHPGSVIRLAAGTYSTAKGFVVSTACTATAPCTLTGGRGAVLDGHGTTGVYGLHLVGASHWTVSGLTVANAAKGLVLDGSSHDVLTGIDVHGIGDEGIHLRSASSDDVVSANVIHDTGLASPGYGEGVYVGSATSNWDTYSGGLPDRSDRNTVSGNQISRTGAENVDIKEGTTGGTLSGNSFDGTGMSGTNYADSWVDVKGNGWQVTGNRGVHALTDGFQVHVAVSGWGQDNVFRSNVADTGSAGYGFLFDRGSAAHTTVACTNTAPTARSGLSNIACH